MQVDWQTLQDLGILHPDGRTASLFAWVNFTRTQGGEQKLRERFRRPGLTVTELAETQDAVRFLALHGDVLDPLLGGSAWLAVEQYARAPLDALSYPNRLFAWLDAWWTRLWNRDVFEQVRSGLAMLQTLVRDAAGVLEALRGPAPPPLLEAWTAELEACLSDPSLVRLRDGREVHRRRPPAVLLADHALRAEEFAPVARLAELVYRVDVLRSLAHATREHGLTLPVIVREGAPTVEAEGLYHPLLDHAVGNPLHLNPGARLLFLTGPNMAGKSTYLKAAGIAVFLAQLGMGVPAASFRWTPFGCLFSGINTTDNVRLGHSYFFREVRRVREVTEILARGTSAFVLFDELFKGTNLRDASDACGAVLSGFASCPGSAFLVASHLAELAAHIEPLPAVAFAHFGAEVREGRPVFDYLLRDGVSGQRLGMLILRREGVLEMLERLRLPAGSV